MSLETLAHVIESLAARFVALAAQASHDIFADVTDRHF